MMALLKQEGCNNFFKALKLGFSFGWHDQVAGLSDSNNRFRLVSWK